MTQVTASAPGKLVLLGEYAVLEGAPALVMAVDRRARVALSTNGDAAWHIVSPTLGLEARLHWRDGLPEWLDTAAPELDWVATLLREAGAAALPACRLELDSAAFYLDAPPARAKLGLGSSAALGVALLGALHALAGRPAPTLAACIAAHRAIQHGHGSGIDIAAALGGGLSVFRRTADVASAVPATLPAGLHGCCVYSGRPASTPALLAAVAAWRAREPEAFAQRMLELATISGRGIDAIATHDADAFLSCLRDYAQALAAFGKQAGVDIASAGHRSLSGIAADCGCVYKSCGAGGGDVGVAFAAAGGPLRDFMARAAADGFRVIDLHADPQGLAVAAQA